MERSRLVARNSGFTLAAQLIVKVLAFAFSVFIIRTLGAETYGQYVAVLAFGVLFVSLSDLGLAPYTVREVARMRAAPDKLEPISDLFANVIRLRFVLSLGAAVLLILAGWLTGRPLFMVGAIALSSLGLLIYSVHGASDAILGGFERFDLSAAARIVSQIVFVVVGAGALYLELGYYGLIIASLISSAVMAVMCWRWVRAMGVHAARPMWRSWPALLRSSMPFAVVAFALGLSYRFDSVLLNISWGDAETGYYGAAYNLIFSSLLISNAVNTALYPSLARLAASEPHRLGEASERVLRYLLLVSLPIATGIWALAGPLVGFLFGPGYEPAASALAILIWVTPLMFVSEFLGYIVLIQGREHRAARAVVISTGLNIAINLALVPTFGLIAAAIVTLVTEAVLVAQYAWAVRGVLRPIDWGRTLLRPMVAAVAMGLLAHSLADLPILLSAGAAAATYCGLVIALGVVGRPELALVRAVLSRQARPSALEVG